MHALLVTFKPEASEAEIMQKIGPKMKEMLPGTPGLAMKTFIAESDHCWGGFYLFTSKEATDAYVAGEFFQFFITSGLISDVKVRQFEVEDEPSSHFGTPMVALADHEAA